MLAQTEVGHGQLMCAAHARNCGRCHLQRRGEPTGYPSVVLGRHEDREAPQPVRQPPMQAHPCALVDARRISGHPRCMWAGLIWCSGGGVDIKNAFDGRAGTGGHRRRQDPHAQLGFRFALGALLSGCARMDGPSREVPRRQHGRKLLSACPASTNERGCRSFGHAARTPRYRRRRYGNDPPGRNAQIG